MTARMCKADMANSLFEDAASEKEKERFKRVSEEVINKAVLRDGGIGTLSEKTTHAVLKEFFMQGEEGADAEVPLEGYVADIYGEKCGVIEIQTRNFGKMKAKLSAFLQKYKVTIVYPIAHHTQLRYIEPETGRVTEGKRSNYVGCVYELFGELCHIIPFLGNENLSFKVALLEEEEFRMADGFGKNKHRRATKCDKLPQALYKLVEIKNTKDFMKFIPDMLVEPFSVKELAEAAYINRYYAQTVIQLLYDMGVVDFTEKRGREYLYVRVRGKSTFSKP